MAKPTLNKLIDLLERRGALRLLRELADGPLGFRALLSRTGARSPTSLSQRLKELQQARLVELEHGEYRFTRDGEDLHRRLRSLFDWR